MTQQEAQAWLGWLTTLGKDDIAMMLTMDGHKDNNYHAEKWQEFSQNRLEFCWQWCAQLWNLYQASKNAIIV